MRIGPEEMADLLSKFVSERTLLECNFRFPAFAARLRGRLVGFDDTELRLMSEDTHSELVLRLEPWLEFAYFDARGVVAASRFEGALTAIFRRGDDGDNDFISLTEIVA